MSAVEDTREARRREEKLLAEVAQGVIVRTLRAELPYARLDKEQAFPLDDCEQRTMAELRQKDLIATEPGADLLRAVVLTSRGRAVLGSPADTDTGLPAVPPLSCDGIHDQNQQIPSAVVVCIDSTGGMKRMLQCADCAARYAANAAGLNVGRYQVDPDAPPAAVYFLPLPQAWTGA